MYELVMDLFFNGLDFNKKNAVNSHRYDSTFFGDSSAPFGLILTRIS